MAWRLNRGALATVTCAACGTSYRAKAGQCPACLVALGQTHLPPVAEGGPVSHVRLYTGINQFVRTKTFAQEAERLARVGWHPGLQSQDAHTLTVTYTRQDPV